MKVTTAPQNVTPLNTDSTTGALAEHLRVHRHQLQSIPSRTAEERLTNRIFQDGSGKNLMKFCRELSAILIRNYGEDKEAGELREKLCASLMVTLDCSKTQAQCLVDLSLELIHAKVHGKYRRSEIELGYLIATATGAVSDVSAN